MNILSVSHYYPPHVGGIEMVAKRQAQSLAQSGDHVSVVTCAPSFKEAGFTVEQGVEVYRIRAWNFFKNRLNIPFPVPGIGVIMTLRHCVKKADLVHIHDVFYLTSLVAALWARFYKKPIFLTQHVAMVKHPSTLVMGVQRMVYGSVGAFMFRNSTSIVVYNPIVHKFLLSQGVAPEKIHEMRNGVDLSLFRPAEGKEKGETRRSFNLPLDKPLVLFVGRFVSKKGFKELLAARSESYELVFAGSGEISAEERALSNVHIVGSLGQARLAELYRAADIFVLPAQGELFTLAMQEAMASSLPTITTPEPEYYESDLDTALVSLVPPHALQLKKEITRLIQDPAQCARMGAYALAYARAHFDWKKNFETLNSLYAPVSAVRGVTVTTSWDDGHVLDFKLGALLKKYGIKGTFYISPKDREIAIEKRLTDEHVRILAEDFEIGAHTMTHPHLTKVDDLTAKEEIYGSKKYLEQVTGRPVLSFCYPAGYFNSTHSAMLKEAGYQLGRTVERFAFSPGKNLFAMPTTIHAYRHWSDALSILRAVGLRKFLACYLNWDRLAIELFETARKTGGVFHLWGHSWELDQNKDWQRLEHVLASISGKPGVRYCSNLETL